LLRRPPGVAVHWQPERISSMQLVEPIHLEDPARAQNALIFASVLTVVWRDQPIALQVVGSKSSASIAAHDGGARNLATFAELS